MPKNRRADLDALLDWPKILERAKHSSRYFCVEKILENLFEESLLIAWEAFYDEGGYSGAAHLLPDGRVVRIHVDNYSLLYGGWWHLWDCDGAQMDLPEDPKLVSDSCQKLSESWYILPNLPDAIDEVRVQQEADPEGGWDDDSGALLRDYLSFLDFLIRANGLAMTATYASFLNHQLSVSELLDWVRSKPILEVGSLEASQLLGRFSSWQRFPSIREMLKALPRKLADQRKVRLFAAACLHRVKHILDECGPHDWIGVVEAFADGHLSEEKLTALQQTAKDTRTALSKKGKVKNKPTNPTSGTDEADSIKARKEALAASEIALGRPKSRISVARMAYRVQAALDPYLSYGDLTAHAKEEGDPLNPTEPGACERVAQTHLLRDIFFDAKEAPPEMDIRWVTTSVRSLASAIYDRHSFEDMPILADALEEAGCTNETILGHCRNSTLHARGCWVIDAVLASRENS